MAVANEGGTDRRARNRARPASGSSSASSSSRGRQTTGGRKTTAANSRSTKRQGTNSKRSTSKASKPAPKAASTASSRSRTSHNGNGNGHDALTEVGIGIVGATVGVAGGILLGRTALRSHRKMMGMPVPDKIDLGGVGQQIGEAGRQFGRLAGEVRAVREKAEQIGRLLT